MADMNQFYLFPNVYPVDLVLFIKKFVFFPSDLRATLIIYQTFFYYLGVILDFLARSIRLEVGKRISVKGQIINILDFLGSHMISV